MTKLTAMPSPAGIPSLSECRKELDDFTNILLGRTDPPFDSGISTLMEVASAALGRALEMQSRIHRGEADGIIRRGSRWYKFRTGELRTFIELARSAVDLGSRRITVARMEQEAVGSY